MPALGISAVVEMRSLREKLQRRTSEFKSSASRLRRKDSKNGQRPTKAELDALAKCRKATRPFIIAFRFATFAWYMLLGTLISAESSSLYWLADRKPPPDDALAACLFWVIIGTIAVMLLLPALLAVYAASGAGKALRDARGLLRDRKKRRTQSILRRGQAIIEGIIKGPRDAK
jgi:hypothetical protein